MKNLIKKSPAMLTMMLALVWMSSCNTLEESPQDIATNPLRADLPTTLDPVPEDMKIAMVELQQNMQAIHELEPELAAAERAYVDGYLATVNALDNDLDGAEAGLRQAVNDSRRHAKRASQALSTITQGFGGLPALDQEAATDWVAWETQIQQDLIDLAEIRLHRNAEYLDLLRTTADQIPRKDAQEMAEQLHNAIELLEENESKLVNPLRGIVEKQSKIMEVEDQSWDQLLQAGLGRYTPEKYVIQFHDLLAVNR